MENCLKILKNLRIRLKYFLFRLLLGTLMFWKGINKVSKSLLKITVGKMNGIELCGTVLNGIQRLKLGF